MSENGGWGVMGTAVCDMCGTEWPCHLGAWGNPARDHNCKVRDCDGRVTWQYENFGTDAPNVDTD